MRSKETLGLIITVVAIILIMYELLYVNLSKGSIGVKGVISSDAIIISAGLLLILIGPWLWLGDVPVAIKKFIEAKTGRRT